MKSMNSVDFALEMVVARKVHANCSNPSEFDSSTNNGNNHDLIFTWEQLKDETSYAYKQVQ